MIKLPSDAGGMGARYFLNSQFNQKLQNDKVYREKEKLRYNVEIETKKIIDEITKQLKSNKNLTLDMAKQQAINKAQTHPNFQQINAYTTTYNKMNFADVITTKFDTYVAKLFPDRASLQTNQVTPTSQTWVPPVEKY
jgi:putative alpha-1,2-mannosidase